MNPTFDDVDRRAQWRALKSLSDPFRRRVFEHLYAADQPKSRDQVAQEFGVSRSLAAFHLDRLADAGLLEVSFARPPGRGGPGAGRPTKRYEATQEVEVALPTREYRRLAEILTTALAEESNNQIWSGVARTAFEAGVQLARSSRPQSDTKSGMAAAVAVLDSVGYMTRRQRTGHLVLRNCPFGGVAEAHPELVCTLNERFVGGLVDGLGMRSRLRVVGDGEAPNCCVTVRQR